MRTIFKRYLELGSVNRLVIELRQRNVRSKVRKLSTGETRGGIAFTQGPLFYMLRNRFYIGEVRYKNEICPGPQPPLMKRELFEAVQAKLTEQRSHQVTLRTKSAALLRDLLFDEAGDPMIPTHATKHGVRYRYYVSQPYRRGIAKPPAGAIIRVPAAEIEGDQGGRGAFPESDELHHRSGLIRSEHRRSQRLSYRGPQEPTGSLAEELGRR